MPYVMRGQVTESKGIVPVRTVISVTVAHFRVVHGVSENFRECNVAISEVLVVPSRTFYLFEFQSTH